MRITDRWYLISRETTDPALTHDPALPADWEEAAHCHVPRLCAQDACNCGCQGCQVQRLMSGTM